MTPTITRDKLITVDWIDSGTEPRHPPNPDFPNGRDIDVSQGRSWCLATLPYPAKRCGYFIVKCEACGANAMVTTAGRVDDPKSVKLACAVPGRERPS